MSTLTSTDNPTTSIDLDFAHYMERRKQELSVHLQGDVPDYSFGMDGKLRRQLAAMGPIRTLAKLMVSTAISLHRQRYTMFGVAVGPKQYPAIYNLGEDCARLLGIGIPQIFIAPDETRNAFTWATDDAAPFIVVTSSLIEVLTLEELKFVIGHECGHIHNLHGIYNSAVEMLVNPVAKTMLTQMILSGLTPSSVELVANLIRGGLQLFMLQWSRCAEITCDRAGVICCGDIEVAQRALMKLVIGGSEQLQEINIQEYLKQLDQIQSGPLRFLELGQTHPLIPKRLKAIHAFSDCEILAGWRSDWKIQSSLRSKEQVDQQCAQIIDAVKG
jgi:Zn-dependent protease with chaperone function